jgi:hypothetical protein
MAWKPIEGAPRDGEPILARRGELRFIVRWREEEGGWSLDLGGEDYCALLHKADEPTEWCELEPLPEAGAAR